MKSKSLFTILTVLVVFCGLVFYNYLQAQKAIQETRPSPLSINLLSFPQSVPVGGQGKFVWHVDASSDLTTPLTTIYWGYQSSPSALTKADSPDAVHYSSSQPDYASGSFKLPSDFDVNISFTRLGRVWFRSYAKVKDDHLWSDEKYLDITN